MEQKLKSERTQRLILEQAFKLFYRDGYSATSIPAITKAAKLSKGAFYHHFQNKQEIGKKVVATVLRQLFYDGMIAPLKESSNEPVIPTLTRVFTQPIANFTTEENRMGCPLNNLINELGCSEEIFRLELRKIIEEWKAILTAFLEQGQQTGQIKKEINTTAAAIFLINAFEGARGIGKIYDDTQNLEAYTVGVTQYLQGLE